MPKNIIEAHGLAKTYLHNGREVVVLRGVDISLPAGESVAVVGPSGAGKSTLLYLLGLLEKPSGGSLYIDNREAGELSDRERSLIRLTRIGFVFQFHHLLPEFTALENVMLPGMMLGRSQSECSKEAALLLSQVNLSDRFNHKPGELSGGEQQRVAFARALMNSPDFILADEPTGNLDHDASGVLEEMMWKLCREQETSLLIVTHNFSLAQKADHFLELNDGVLNPANQ